MTTSDVVAVFFERSGLGAAPDLSEVVDALCAVPYGRPSVRDVAHLVDEWRGTCSTKHDLLVRVIAERFHGLDPQVIHRVYRVTRSTAPAETVSVVPEDGLVDVHRFVTVQLGARRIVLDVTFPRQKWDGVSSMRPACGPGADRPAVGDIDRHKRDLEERFCDPQVREPFIAALAGRSAER